MWRTFSQRRVVYIHLIYKSHGHPWTSQFTYKWGENIIYWRAQMGNGVAIALAFVERKCPFPVIAVKVRAYSTSAEETLCLSSFRTFFFLPMQMWFTLWITLHFWSPNTSFFPLVYIYMSFLNNYYYCILMLTLFTCQALFQAHYTIIIHINYYIIDMLII